MLPGGEECQATKGHHKACQHGGETPSSQSEQTVSKRLGVEAQPVISGFLKSRNGEQFHENK